jgi:hypothetical protein
MPRLFGPNPKYSAQARSTSDRFDEKTGSQGSRANSGQTVPWLLTGLSFDTLGVYRGFEQLKHVVPLLFPHIINVSD